MGQHTPQRSDDDHDVIVVGARCAGAPLAMLLAREGRRVVVVDRATFPSDTLSTHLIHPPGVAALDRWGLLERVVATGAPPIDTYDFDFGPFTISGHPGTSEHPAAYAPRRTVLDGLLVDAAREAGAEVREGFRVDEVLIERGRACGIRGRDGGGRQVTLRAPITVGADGRNSLVARALDVPTYAEKPPLLAAYYSYWEGVDWDGRFANFDRPSRGLAVWPTNDDLLLVIAGWPTSEFQEHRRDVEGAFTATLGLVPDLAARLAAGRRVERFAGTSVPNYFRKPYGPGWALVGDAGYCRDFITAQGIQDAFLDAERCAEAIVASDGGGVSYQDAMSDYHEARDDRVAAMYEFTTSLASLEPPPPEVQELLAATAGQQVHMDAFARVAAGVTSPAAFFSPENAARVAASAA